MGISTDAERSHDWHEAGEAWGHAAADWACLWEHYAVAVLTAMLPALGVGPGCTLLDIACGSGWAVHHADATGADVAGIDASEVLLAIARARTPGADLRLGSMFALPWADASFDAAVAINGIWGGCEAALDEAFRVIRPGGMIGVSFWGEGRPLDLRACFKVLGRHSPREHLGSMKRLNDISAPGTAEAMLVASGFEVVDRGGRISMVEWPDPEIAWRAMASIGPAVPALRSADVDALKRDLLEAMEPCRDELGIYRFRNDHQYVIARRP